MQTISKYEELMFLINNYANNLYIRIFILAQIITRLVLFGWAYKSNLLPFESIISILASGLLGDIAASFFGLPIIAIIQRYGYGRFLGQFLFNLILVFTFISQMIFWDEFGTNFNFIAVDYLIYTHEIWGTVKESMPIYPILAGFLLFTIILTKATLKLQSEKPSKKLILAMIICALTLGSIYNSDKIGSSGNNYSHEIGKNGPYEFFHAFFKNSLDYNKFYPNIASYRALENAKSYVARENHTFLMDGNIGRNVTNSGFFTRKNVVVIMVESLSAEFMNHFGNKESITPNLDKLAKESLFFTNIYATGTRTVRGLEALTLSIPPLPGTSIIKRPNNHNLFTLGVPFRDNGYVTDFIYGGYSYFDNQEEYFASNHFVVTDRNNLTKDEITFSNIWGVADEDIFKKSIEKFDARHRKNKNFFSLIMTTSNHRPYNFPEGRIDMKSGSGRAAAVKYTDYAIGEFIRQASLKPWFKDTIFVVTADHCASSAGKTKLPVHKYHIPLIIYSPDFIEPQISNKLASQIDIGPTILGMMNFSYMSKFYGQDLTRYNPNRAFISTYQLLGYLEDDKMVILSPNNDPATFRIEKEKQILMEGRKDLTDRAISYYQSAYELFYKGQMKEDL